MRAVPPDPCLPSATRRLRLRALTPADAPFIVELLNSPGWLRFIGDRQVHTPDQALAWLRDGPMAMQAQHGFALWAVQRRSDDVTIGICGLVRRQGLDDPDIGYAFLPQHLRRGYAREAAATTLRHAVETLGLPRVAAITRPDNAASVRVLESIGMHFERGLRLPGHDADSLLFTAQGASADK